MMVLTGIHIFILQGPPQKKVHTCELRCEQTSVVFQWHIVSQDRFVCVCGGVITWLWLVERDSKPRFGA